MQRLSGSTRANGLRFHPFTTGMNGLISKPRAAPCRRSFAIPNRRLDTELAGSGPPDWVRLYKNEQTWLYNINNWSSTTIFFREVVMTKMLDYSEAIVRREAPPP